MSKRLYSNKEIEEKVAIAASQLSNSDLAKLCRQDYSKIVFDINYALLLKVPEHYTYSEKIEAVKDEAGVNRWTWKFEFHKNGFAYAITTQWYPRNDEYVKNWLRKNA